LFTNLGETDRKMKMAFTHRELPTAMEGLQKLCKMTNVFPSPDQELWLGQKVDLTDKLAEIAKSVTKTAFPKHFLIKDPSDPRVMMGNNLYIKRSYSHRRLGVQPGSDREDFKEKLMEWVEDTKKGYIHESLWLLEVEALWIGTSFLDTMTQVGEIRVYFVGGRERRRILITREAGGLTPSQRSEDFVQ
jgi:hypothetical protein